MIGGSRNIYSVTALEYVLGSIWIVSLGYLTISVGFGYYVSGIVLILMIFTMACVVAGFLVIKRPKHQRTLAGVSLLTVLLCFYSLDRYRFFADGDIAHLKTINDLMDFRWMRRFAIAEPLQVIENSSLHISVDDELYVAPLVPKGWTNADPVRAFLQCTAPRGETCLGRQPVHSGFFIQAHEIGFKANAAPGPEAFRESFGLKVPLGSIILEAIADPEGQLTRERFALISTPVGCAALFCGIVLVRRKIA